MSIYDYHIIRLGDDSLLIQIKEEASQELLYWLLAKSKRLSRIFNVEVIHTYNELLIKKYLLFTEDIEFFKKEITYQMSLPEPMSNNDVTIHRIPVCYEKEYAPDLIDFALQTKLSVAEVIKLHSSRVYPIYFLGFLPGFPYLENLDPRLYLDRKSIPSQVIAKGSVAIGGRQTGIYPQESPGGWHVIGRTPVSLFNSDKVAPSIFKPGDGIMFYEITTAEFSTHPNTTSV